MLNWLLNLRGALIEMPEAGGPTTQSGIFYQNSIAALYLGRLLDTSQRPANERVMKVRVEAPESVDDIVVSYADEHRVFIQAKENIASKSDEWRKLWRDFDEQFRNPLFRQQKDRLLLQIGELRSEHADLREMCQRSANSPSVDEWKQRLTKTHHALLEKIKPSLPPEHLTDQYLLELLGHVEVEIAPLNVVERDYALYWMPKTNKDALELFRLLRDRIGSYGRVRGVFTSSLLRQSLLSESTGLRFELPHDINVLRQAIQQCGSLLRHHKETFADTGIHIEREVVDQIVEWLLDEENPEKNVAMLLDQAGMGKSVVMRRVLQSLEDKKIDVLAIKADQQLSNVSTLSQIQLRLNLPDPVEQIIARLAQLNRVVVIVDQIDALSLSLAHDQPTLDLTLDLIARLRRLPNTRILLSCRIFDRNTNPRLNCIELGRSFSLQALSTEQIADVLTCLQVNSSLLLEATKDLLRVPLHLDLFARVIVNQASVKQLQGIASLQELYALIWQNVVLKQETGSPPVSHRLEVIERLTQFMDESQRTSAPQSLLHTKETNHLQQAVSWLARNGILLPDASNWAFLHQTFFDYCYARQFVDSGGDIVTAVLSSKQGIFERPKLLQIIAYLRGSDHHRYIHSLNCLFNAPNLRFHLYNFLLGWFGSLPNPTDDEWLIAQQMLQNEKKRWQLLSTMHGNANWFERLQSTLNSWLANGNETQITQALSYLTSLIEIKQTDVALMLKPFISKNAEWKQRIRDALYRIRNWHTLEAVELYEKVSDDPETIDPHLLWPLDDISRRFPQAGCRILRRTFDLIVSQYLEAQQDSEDKNGAAGLFSARHLFDGLRNREDAIEKALKSTSELTPKPFVEAMLPWLTKVVHLSPEPDEDRNWYASDALSHDWHDNAFHIQRVFLDSFVKALTKLAKHEPEYFHTLADNLMQIPSQTPQKLLARIYTALAEIYAEDAFHFLITEQRRLDLGEEQYDSRQVLAAIYPHLTIDQHHQLETYILNYAPIRKYYGLDALRWYGLEQYRLLHAIPKEYLSSQGLKRHQEWERKFFDYKISDKPITSRGGWVGPPIDEEKTYKMSDRSWLQAMAHYKGATQHRDFLRGGAEQLSSILAKQIPENPTRFYKLFQLTPNDIDDAYATAFINGFAEVTATTEWFFDVVRHFASQAGRDIQRPIARAVEKRAKSNVPDDILTLLIRWVYQPMKDDERWWQKGTNHGNAYSSYLNSDRGAAFSASMRVLGERKASEAQALKWQLIEFTASDPSTALRIGAIHELIYMIRYDHSRAWQLFEQLVADHEALLSSQYVREFLYWVFNKNFLSVSPYIKAMMHHADEKVQESGAELACIAAISDGAMESEEAHVAARTLADQAITGKPSWRRGAAHIYTHNMTHGSDTKIHRLCQTKVCQLIDDEDNGVREKIDSKFYELTENFFFELRDFVEEYALAERHPLQHQLAKYLWENGMKDSDWSLAIIETLLHKNEQPDQWYSGMEELMRLILQIHTSPIVNEETMEKAIETFDLMMRQYTGTANKILSEWDRR